MTPSPVVKRSINVNGHKTSVSLEDEFWNHVRRIAEERNVSVGNFISEIDHARTKRNLSSALRVAVVADLEGRAAGMRAAE